jgi:hypothetical protein
MEFDYKIENLFHGKMRLWSLFKCISVQFSEFVYFVPFSCICLIHWFGLVTMKFLLRMSGECGPFWENTFKRDSLTKRVPLRFELNWKPSFYLKRFVQTNCLYSTPGRWKIFERTESKTFLQSQMCHQTANWREADTEIHTHSYWEKTWFSSKTSLTTPLDKNKVKLLILISSLHFDERPPYHSSCTMNFLDFSPVDTYELPQARLSILPQQLFLAKITKDQLCSKLQTLLQLIFLAERF